MAALAHLAGDGGGRFQTTTDNHPGTGGLGDLSSEVCAGFASSPAALSAAKIKSACRLSTAPEVTTNTPGSLNHVKIVGHGCHSLVIPADLTDCNICCANGYASTSPGSLCTVTLIDILPRSMAAIVRLCASVRMRGPASFRKLSSAASAWACDAWACVLALSSSVAVLVICAASAVNARSFSATKVGRA